MVLLRKDEAVTEHLNWDIILLPTSLLTSKHTALWSNASVLSNSNGFFFFSSRFFDGSFFDTSDAIKRIQRLRLWKLTGLRVGRLFHLQVGRIFFDQGQHALRRRWVFLLFNAFLRREFLWYIRCNKRIQRRRLWKLTRLRVGRLFHLRVGRLFFDQGWHALCRRL